MLRQPGVTVLGSRGEIVERMREAVVRGRLAEGPPKLVDRLAG